jgi:hypothetical protein
MTPTDLPPLKRVWDAVTIASISLVAGGMLVLLFVAGPETLVWIFVAFFAASTASSIAVAVISYRRTMRRPWPKVAPLSDDDWDD